MLDGIRIIIRPAQQIIKGQRNFFHRPKRNDGESALFPAVIKFHAFNLRPEDGVGILTLGTCAEPEDDQAKRGKDDLGRIAPSGKFIHENLFL